VGAYGQEVSETIREVRCFDRESKTIVALTNTDCGFSYRRSIFNSTMRDRYVVLAGVFDLVANGEPKLVYKDLIDQFKGREPSLSEVRAAVLTIRRAKSMVIDVQDPNSQSAGSFFKNPLVELSILEKIEEQFDRVPHFEAGEKVKIPAAWLIENAGLEKGFRLGNAGISSNHTLALINCGGSTATEIIELKDLIQRRVETQFGIHLEPEPIFVGF
ncbi:MAG: UDP-N-acetylenolpyruvoylglucosamine reductase, partial [Pyrinomonadaceae bacterium]